MDSFVLQNGFCYIGSAFMNQPPLSRDPYLVKSVVKDGALATPSGMRYRVLALDPHARQMSLPVSHKIRDLVMERAVCGAKPASDPSLADDNEVQAQGQ
jgi:hypothetical protein